MPQVHLALGSYYWLGHLDYDTALREYAIAEAGLPNHSDVLVPRAVLRLRQGKPDEGFADLEKARQLDPGAANIAYECAFNRDFARDFARAETFYDRAIALLPDYSYPYYWKAGLYLRWEGSTQKARAVLDEARTMGLTDDPLLLRQRVRVDIFDRRYEEAIRELASGAPEVIAGDLGFVPRALLYAEAYGLMQRHDLERAYYDSARSVVSRQLQGHPDDPRLRSALGIAYAGLGRKQDAIREGQTGVELLPISKDANGGYYRAWDLARIYAMVGESGAAVDRLEHLLSIPGPLTAAWLRIDPTWDPLRGNPRFQRLVDRR
ncbi:MAG: tetratricopeptide repeat protein [Gemmatimonadales bacterium]